MGRFQARGRRFWLALLPSGMSLAIAACAGLATTAPAITVARETPRVESLLEAEDPHAMSGLDYEMLELGKTSKSRFEDDDPKLVVDGYNSRFKAFTVPVAGFPMKIIVETATAFEVPHFPRKYLFCPRILLLDSKFGIVHSSAFEDLEKKQRIFGEPRFVLDYTLAPESSKARYLLVVRESVFDGQYVKSMYEDDSGQYDSLLRKKRERIYSSRTGPVKVTLKRRAR